MHFLSRTNIRSERGQALVEFALFAPILFLFLLLLVDFGLALDRRQVIQHAAREGARQGAVGLGPTAVQQLTVDQSGGELTTANVAVCYVDGDDAGTTPGNAGDRIRVQIVYYSYNFAAGSGELLSAFGIGAPSIDMDPYAEANLERSVPGAGADQC